MFTEALVTGNNIQDFLNVVPEEKGIHAVLIDKTLGRDDLFVDTRLLRDHVTKLREEKKSHWNCMRTL